MLKIFEILQREDGCLSLPRICAFIGFLVVCGLLLGEMFGKDVKHLPEFMMFVSGLFAYCWGGKYLDLKGGKAGGM